MPKFPRTRPTQADSGIAVAQINSKNEIVEDKKQQDHRLHAEQALQHSEEELRVLQRVGATLSSELDLKKLVQTVTDAGRELSEAAFGAFFYNAVASDGEKYLLYTLSGAPIEAFERFGMPRNTAVFAPTFAGERTIRVDDILKYPHYGKNPPNHGMPKGHLPVRSYLAVPVISRSREVLGGLFYGHPQPGVFTERAERLVEGVAKQAAIAIDNARLFETVKRERIQAEIAAERLRESEADARRLLELHQTTMTNMGEGMYTVDTQGLVTYMNPEAERLFGWKCKELLGRRMHDVTHYKHPDGSPFPIEQCAGFQVLHQGKVIKDFEDSFIRKDGSFFPVSYSSSPLRGHDGELTGLVVVFRDITERKRSEEALRRADKLAATGQLAAAVAHEINNPMQALTNLMGLISYQCSQDENARHLSAMAQNELRRMAQIAKQMLAFHRDTATPVPVRITEVLEDILELWILKLRDQRIKIERRYEVVDNVQAFPGELRQVFANLLTNAAEALPSGGTITLHAFPSRDWKNLDRKGIRVTVADNGLGITAEHRRKIFEAFYTTKAEKGTGLGLWVVKGMIEKHQGSLRVRSSDRGARRGTCFSVFLPYVADDNLLTAAPTSSNMAASDKK